MPILRALDGKFYDLPDDEAAKFEVPLEKVKELLAKSGAPEQRPGGGGPAGQRGGPSPGSPIVVQIFPSGGSGPSGQPAPQQQQQGGGGDGEVQPYYWANYWNNWPNWNNWGNWWNNY